MICSMCQTIFAADRQVTPVRIQAVTPYTYPHYQSGEQLYESVEAGCQICNLTWNRMSEDARLGVTTGYRNGWIHDASRVGSMWYSIIADDNNTSSTRGQLTVYLSYGYRPNEIPRSATISAEYPGMTIAKIVPPYTVAFFAIPTEPSSISDTFHIVSDSTDSDHSWQLAQNWFHECITSHTACSLKIHKSHWQPRRLLNLESRDGVSVKLQINEANSPIETYVSLSHCWGKVKLNRLLKSNIEVFQNGIPEHDLPKTFREAILITRKLGYQFIWIDSLCIIQDSVEDWRHEAETMGDVYRNAVLNIAATGSSDSSEGCFSARDPNIIKPCYVTSSWQEASGTYQIHDSALWRLGVTRAPLNTRAWVIQEISLAKRVLHFSKSQLFWECDQKTACETFPRGIPVTQVEVTPRINSFFFNHFSNGRLKCFSEDWSGLLQPDPQLRAYDLWSNVVGAYTKCHLSHPTDKLIALSGLAKEMRELTKDEYLAGLWRKHLTKHLLWFVETTSEGDKTSSHQQHPFKYCAPSWSWASTEGEVVDHPVASLHGEKILIDILDVQVQTATTDTTGECTGGILKLRGVLRPVRWAWIEEDEFHSLFLEDEQLDFSIAFPDRIDYVTPDTVFCLPIHMFDVDIEEPRLYGLILCPCDETGNTFKRLGQFKVDFEHCATIADVGLERQDIIII